MNYVEELEKQNEELKDALADVQLQYIPDWRHCSETKWVYETPSITFATVCRFTDKRGEYVWHMSFFGGGLEGAEFKSSDEAKAYIEQMLWKDRFYKNKLT